MNYFSEGDKMKKNILRASILAVLMSSTALADTSSMSTTTTGMGVLANDYVTAGVNGTAGTFGSGGNTSPGLLFDSTGTGTFNTSYDYLTPGSPFDGFAVKVDGTNYTNNNGGSTAIAGDGNGLTDGTDTLSWTGGVASVFDITNTYTLGATSPYVDITSQITMGVDASDVYFGRFIDPDARAAAGDSSSTDNVLGYGTIPDSNVAFSEALSSRYALGLYSTDSNVDAGITSWTTDADSYTENSVDGDGSLTNTGDNTIGLSWHWTSVSSGDILTASYAYIFGPSAFDAASDAVDGGAGGGADVTGGAGVSDIGSATDAASGTTTPTLVSTSDPTTSYGAWSDWETNTALPILTQTQTTHDSSVALGVQTIDRETTTVVTTPEKRTRTTTTTVVDTYSDGSTETRTTGTGTETETQNTAATTITDPGAFVGRMDQVDQMIALNTHKNLGIGSGISGGRISHDMGNGYSAESDVLSLGGRATLDNGVTIGAGLNKVDTTMTGSASTGTMSSTVLSFEASKHIDDRDMTVRGNINTASSDLAYTRTIGDFGAAGETTSRDSWGSLTVEKSTGAVRPFAAYTIGKNTVDAYNETGDIQAVLSHDAVDESYRFATLGVNIDTGLITASIARDFDDADTMRFGLGIDKDINDRVSIGATAQRTTAGDNTSTFVSAGLKIRF